MASTAITNQAETLSASFWIGARLRCASATIATMRASSVSEPTRSARITSEPVPLTVAPTTFEPCSFSTGIGSPETIDSSMLLRPSSTTPSTGTFSPGRTRRRSPTWTWASGTSCSLPSGSIRRASLAAKPARALSSSTWPSSTSAVITAAASK